MARSLTYEEADMRIDRFLYPLTLYTFYNKDILYEYKNVPFAIVFATTIAPSSVSEP